MELERHIEILLLENDCVIVPDLGGFMTHHLEARYDEEDHMFLPPLRTLGFNPQLKLNDSLLAQSYVEAYDISYPEAIRRIDAEVTELKQHLDNEGYYELNDIGRLTVNEEGNLEFEPCEAGILTPSLYGLSTFEFKQLQQVKEAPAEQPDTKIVSIEDHAEVLEDEEGSSTHTITIKMSWVRNTIAVAAAILAFFIVSKPVSNELHQTEASMTQVNLPLIKKDSTPKVSAKLDQKAIKKALTAVETKVADSIVDTAASKSVTISVPTVTYCIVMASQVTQRNAETFVKKLKSMGIDDARVFNHHNTRRVVCGNYTTEAEAYQHLPAIHHMDGLADAWVYKFKN